MVAWDGVWDLLIFVAYISIPLEIVVFACGLHRKILDGKITNGKCILLSVAFLFVAFIICCGITHFLSFLHALECDSGPTLPYCLHIMERGPMSDVISSAKATTAVVSCVTAVVLGLVMKQLLQFLALFSLLDTKVQDVEDALRVLLSSSDIYSTHVCPTLNFRSISESGHWLLERARVAADNVQASTLFDLMAEDDRPRVERELHALMWPAPAPRCGEPSVISEPSAGTDEASQSLLDLEAGPAYALAGRQRESPRIEYRLRGAPGQSLRWVESCFVFDAQSSVVHVVTRDIEARKDEERRRAEERELQAAQENVQRWLHYMSCVAHDLKTPLTCFEMAIGEIAQDDGISADSSAALEHARAACGVLRSTVAQAVEVRSSVTNGIKPTPRSTAVDVRELFHTISTMVPALSISKAISVVFEVASEVPARVESDGGFLMQMCLNLLSNSCKYTPQGGVTTRAMTVAGEDGREMLRVEVQDTGVGMRPERTSKLFEPFYLAQKAQGTGTGLGLYSVKMHAEALGGRCGYKPVPACEGSGSIFFFEVPLLPLDTCPDDADEKALVKPLRKNSDRRVGIPHGPTPSLSVPLVTCKGDEVTGKGDVVTCKGDVVTGKGDVVTGKTSDKSEVLAGPAAATRAVTSHNGKISKASKPQPSAAVLAFRARVRRCLVVDDVESIRKLLAARLRRLAPDITIDTCENGLEGFNTWHTAVEKYDLIVTDVVMPLMSGPEMVARIREAEGGDGGRVGVVGMSANTAPEERQTYLESGMDYFMTKPIPSNNEEMVKGLLAALDK